MASKSSTVAVIVAEVSAIPLAQPSVSPMTKKSQLIAMLGAGGCSTITAISQAFGWQPHTTRAAITDLRKAGHQIKATSGENGTSYQIVVTVPDEPQAMANGA